MSVPNSRPPLRKVPLLTRYTIVWGFLGALGAGYLGVAIVAPQTLQDLSLHSSGLDMTSAENIHAVGRVATEIGELRDSVSQLQLDVTKLKTDVSGQSDFAATLKTQVIALEDRVKSQEQPVQANATPEQSIEPDAKARAKVQAPAQSPAVRSPREASTGSGGPPTKVINSTAPTATSDPAEITTGSVTDLVKSAKGEGLDFGPAVVTPAAKPIGLRLSKGQSVDSLRLSWSLLADRHGASLGKLQARFVEGGEAGAPEFDLIAGPVKTKADAIRICKDLVQQDVPCKVDEFKGEAL